MAKAKVLVTRRWPEEVEAALREMFDVTLNEQDAPLTQAQLSEAMRTHDALCPCVADRISADVLQTPERRARIVASYGVGYDHIDIQAARDAGLVVTNTPGVLTESTADLAMTLMLMAARRAGEGERQLRRGDWAGWHPTHLMGGMVTGATLGIVGMGRIGQAMARKAYHGFGMSILYHNRRPIDEAAAGEVGATWCENLNDLLERSDFVALHCPGGDATRHLIDEAALRRMKSTAYLINTSRGNVVDEAALIRALEEGWIAGAGLDVYEREPEVPVALSRLDNAVLLPHLGSATRQTRTAMGMRVLDNLRAFFDGQEPGDRVE